MSITEVEEAARLFDDEPLRWLEANELNDNSLLMSSYQQWEKTNE